MRSVARVMVMVSVYDDDAKLGLADDRLPWGPDVGEG